MCIHICMYTSIYVYHPSAVYIQTYTQKHTYTCMHMNAHTYLISMCLHNTHRDTQKHTPRMYIPEYNTDKYIYIYIYIHIYTYASCTHMPSTNMHTQNTKITWTCFTLVGCLRTYTHTHTKIHINSHWTCFLFSCYILVRYHTYLQTYICIHTHTHTHTHAHAYQPHMGVFYPSWACTYTIYIYIYI
jgi:hypothetical protein